MKLEVQVYSIAPTITTNSHRRTIQGSHFGKTVGFEFEFEFVTVGPSETSPAYQTN